MSEDGIAVTTDDTGYGRLNRRPRTDHDGWRTSSTEGEKKTVQAGWQTAWAWLVLVVLAVDEIWSLVGKQLEQDFSVMIVRTDERDYIMEEQKRHNYFTSKSTLPLSTNSWDLY